MWFMISFSQVSSHLYGSWHKVNLCSMVIAVFLEHQDMRIHPPPSLKAECSIMAITKMRTCDFSEGYSAMIKSTDFLSPSSLAGSVVRQIRRKY